MAARTAKKQIPSLTARTADRHALYERSVQDTSFDIRFIRRVFKKQTGRLPISLREDFCGTARLCADWAKRDKNAFALGVDLDEPTLNYGRQTHLEPMGDSARRVELVCRDVRDPHPDEVDVCVAFNFSYWIFKDRRELVDYFSCALRHVKEGGAFMLDIYGGPDAQIETEEETEHEDFTYVWEQGPMDAITGEAMRYIHFHFDDGSKIQKAYVYDWRIWSLPEVQDALRDAGFSSVDVYWEGADGDGDGNGIFKKTRRAENEDAWIAYIAAWR